MEDQKDSIPVFPREEPAHTPTPEKTVCTLRTLSVAQIMSLRSLFLKEKAGFIQIEKIAMVVNDKTHAQVLRVHLLKHPDAHADYYSPSLITDPINVVQMYSFGSYEGLPIPWIADCVEI